MQNCKLEPSLCGAKVATAAGFTVVVILLWPQIMISHKLRLPNHTAQFHCDCAYSHRCARDCCALCRQWLPHCKRPQCMVVMVTTQRHVTFWVSSGQRTGTLQCHAAGEQLLAEQKDQGLRYMLTSALTKVMSANGINQSLDRSNKKVFRENLGEFVVDARSIVRVR